MNLGKSRNNHHSNSINIVILNKVKNPFVSHPVEGSLFVQNDFTFVINGSYFEQPFTFVENNNLITNI